MSGDGQAWAGAGPSRSSWSRAPCWHCRPGPQLWDRRHRGAPGSAGRRQAVLRLPRGRAPRGHTRRSDRQRGGALRACPAGEPPRGRGPGRRPERDGPQRAEARRRAHRPGGGRPRGRGDALGAGQPHGARPHGGGRRRDDVVRPHGRPGIRLHVPALPPVLPRHPHLRRRPARQPRPRRSHPQRHRRAGVRPAASPSVAPGLERRRCPASAAATTSACGVRSTCTSGPAGDRQVTRFARGDFARLVLFDGADGVRLAWHVTLPRHLAGALRRGRRRHAPARSCTART